MNTTNKKGVSNMRYNFNGKTLNIPDAELQKSMKLLGLTKDEAIKMWLEDEGYLDNEEQEELCEKAKANRITSTIHDAGDKKKNKSKPKTVKVSDEKQALFAELHEKMCEYCDEINGICEILKENKLISVKIGEKTFKIDLIEQRPPKK